MRSAAEQSLAPGEIVVVDDGSEVPLAETDFAFSTVPVRLVRLAGNAGGGAARNAGITASSCEWIALLDSDDTWLPDKLDVQVRDLMGSEDPTRAVATCNVLVHRPQGPDAPYNLSAGRPQGSLADWLLASGGTYQTSGLVLQRDLALRVGFREDLARHQDWDFVLRLDRAGATFLYDESCLVVYDSADDSARVSRSISPGPTLFWFKSSGLPLAGWAMHEYYLYTFFWDHLRREPVQAMRALIGLMVRRRGGLWVTARYLMWKLVRALGLHQGGNEPRSATPSA